MLVHINLITRTAPKWAKQEHKLGQDLRYTIESGKTYFSDTSRCRVEDLSGNIGGTLISKDGKTTYSFDVMPGSRSMDYIQKFLTKKHEEIKTACAFLCGGLQGTDSTPLYSGMANIFDELHIPIAMICGKFSPKNTDNMQVHGHIINLWGENFSKMNPLMKRNSIQEMLEEEYETVEIPDFVGIKIFEKEPSYFNAASYYDTKINLKV